MCEKLEGTKLLILVNLALRWLIPIFSKISQNRFESFKKRSETVCKLVENKKQIVTKIIFYIVSWESHFWYLISCLKFEHLKVVIMANNYRIRPQVHVIGPIANNIQYIILIVVIHNLKVSQPHFDLKSTLGSRSPNNHM